MEYVEGTANGRQAVSRRRLTEECERPRQATVRRNIAIGRSALGQAHGGQAETREHTATAIRMLHAKGRHAGPLRHTNSNGPGGSRHISRGVSQDDSNQCHRGHNGQGRREGRHCDGTPGGHQWQATDCHTLTPSNVNWKARAIDACPEQAKASIIHSHSRLHSLASTGTVTLPADFVALPESISVRMTIPTSKALFTGIARPRWAH